jgi:hypothetical protein
MQAAWQITGCPLDVQELYSGGNDLSIVVDAPLQRRQPEEQLGLSEQAAKGDEDRWSDDDL